MLAERGGVLGAWSGTTRARAAPVGSGHSGVRRARPIWRGGRCSVRVCACSPRARLTSMYMSRKYVGEPFRSAHAFLASLIGRVAPHSLISTRVTAWRKSETLEKNWTIDAVPKTARWSVRQPSDQTKPCNHRSILWTASFLYASDKSMAQRTTCSSEMPLSRSECATETAVSAGIHALSTATALARRPTSGRNGPTHSSRGRALLRLSASSSAESSVVTRYLIARWSVPSLARFHLSCSATLRATKRIGTYGKPTVPRVIHCRSGLASSSMESRAGPKLRCSPLW